MSEFNVGDKVYLECEVDGIDVSDNTYGLKYRDWHGDECFTNYVTNDVLHPTDEAYNKGLNDAWGLARKIVLPMDKGGYTADELRNIFSKNTYMAAMSDFTPQEALAKVKAYEEERNEIRVGDVVKLKRASYESIVTRVAETSIFCLFKDGSCDNYINKENLVKTGKHFDSIDEFMRS